MKLRLDRYTDGDMLFFMAIEGWPVSFEEIEKLVREAVKEYKLNKTIECIKFEETAPQRHGGGGRITQFVEVAVR